jgi:isocitrate dehydrogenase
MTINVALATGDGIGPEITEAVLSIFDAAQVPVSFHCVEMGQAVFQRGITSGMTPEAKTTIEKLGLLFKGPMETPKGKGVKSINVTARKVWNTYANKRVFRSLNGVDTPFSRAGIPINLTLVRENIEDTYGGIEHFLTRDVALCRRFITRPGSEQVHRYTFEMARKNGHSKVTCGHKANIMKLTDGLFLEVFYEIAKKYPEISANDVIVDDLAMKLVRLPDQFEVIVLPNLQGDIISDLCAGLVGGLGFAPSANIGDSVAIFEAVHGTAPDIAGKGLANPTSLLMSGLMMLRHVGLHGKAALIENALLVTLESGIHTADFGSPDVKASSTKDFANAIISNLGSVPGNRAARGSDVPYNSPSPHGLTNRMLESAPSSEQVVGVDLFVESNRQPNALAQSIQSLLSSRHTLTLISNRGTQVWPSGSVLTDCVNQYRVRIEVSEEPAATSGEMLNVAFQVSEHMKVCSTEILMNYNGTAAYSLAQGQ